MSRSILVIGYGNPLRQDDGFGYRVAELLQEASLEGVQALACHQLTPELAEPLSRCVVALFVDAREGEPVGQLEWETVTADPSAQMLFAHSLTPANLLALAQTLYGSAPARAYLLTVRSVHFAHAEGLSPAVEKAVKQAVAQIKHLRENTISIA
ncbi:MAG: hydrogenase maturation protease [Armatimonadota bacterium]|nr:hydrogenase maturation protease [Armatimonadota bacterium]